MLDSSLAPTLKVPTFTFKYWPREDAEADGTGTGRDGGAGGQAPIHVEGGEADMLLEVKQLTHLNTLSANG